MINTSETPLPERYQDLETRTRHIFEAMAKVFYGGDYDLAWEYVVEHSKTRVVHQLPPPYAGTAEINLRLPHKP